MQDLKQSYDKVAQQLEVASKAKEKTQHEVIELTAQRQQLTRDLEKLDNKFKGNTDAAGKL